ncbi:hypothetical protein H2204_008659 [Knufia peltigerae]|uniref:Enoyl-CoA hydratase n=1 Tax=Knufia peltigerae TaxID=1002370 RepID=A0AA39CWP2_9EURO|nr:hypothetical protein H2204_008659 [Knufia peltigerae]
MNTSSIVSRRMLGTMSTSTSAMAYPRILFQGSTRSRTLQPNRLFPGGGAGNHLTGLQRHHSAIATFHTSSPGRENVRTTTSADTTTTTTTKQENLEFLKTFEEVESSHEPRRRDDSGSDTDGQNGRIEYTVWRRRQTSDGDSEIATVRINNPTRANSLGSVLLNGLTNILSELASRRDLRLVEITGCPPPPRWSTESTSDGSSGGSGGGGGGVPKFCAGADLREMYSLTTPLEARRFITSVRDACQALRDMPVPTLAKVDGATLGAGLELAASCDFRVATRRSAFAMPEVKVGIPSVVQARLLANIVGWQRTRELVYLGRTVDGSTAARWGLVDRLTETPEDLDDACLEMARTMVENGPRAMRSQKRLIRLWEEQPLQAGVDAGVTEFADMWTEDGGEEVKKYMGRVLIRKNKGSEKR